MEQAESLEEEAEELEEEAEELEDEADAIESAAEDLAGNRRRELMANAQRASERRCHTLHPPSRRSRRVRGLRHRDSEPQSSGGHRREPRKR